MEKQFFDWDYWDQIDALDFNFGNITLKVPIGSYPAGTKFEGANVSYSNGTIEFWEYGKDDSVMKINIELRIV